jgi:diadenosine tetraphosphate (Ap4A) HIT family hydrolase
MNVAALGNVVRQLHVHHIARFTDDPAWPQPIWGAVPHRDYSDELLNERLKKLRNALVGDDFTVIK